VLHPALVKYIHTVLSKVCTTELLSMFASL